jgi:chromosome partitioning protein
MGGGANPFWGPRVRTIAIINQKGGCGKTTTAINLAAALAERNHRVLLVDLDPQSHCAAGLAVPEAKIDQDVGDAMLAEPGRTLDPARFLWRITKGLDLLPSRTKLAAVEAPASGIAGTEGAEQRLVRAFSRLGVDKTHDYCIIDCPPSIGLLTYNALAAAREILIPVETSYFSLLGAQKQRRTVRSVGRRLGLRHAVRLLPTIHDETRTLARDLLAELRRQFEVDLIPVVIRNDAALPEAASFGRPVVEFASQSHGSLDYRALCNWIMENAGTNESITDDADSAGDDDAGLPEINVVQREVPRLRQAVGDGTVSAGPDPRPLAENGHAVAAQHAHAGVSTASRAEEIGSRAHQMHDTGKSPRYRVRAVSGPLRLIEEIEPDIDRVKRAQVSRFFGARAAGGRILFVQPIELGQRIHVVGSFNDWNPLSHPMRRNDELAIHELALDVDPGEHQYRLLINGVWADDPNAEHRSPNQFGGYNAIVKVDPA